MCMQEKLEEQMVSLPESQVFSTVTVRIGLRYPEWCLEHLPESWWEIQSSHTDHVAASEVEAHRGHTQDCGESHGLAPWRSPLETPPEPWSHTDPEGGLHRNLGPEEPQLPIQAKTHYEEACLHWNKYVNLKMWVTWSTPFLQNCR